MSGGWNALFGALTLLALLGATGSISAWALGSILLRTRWSAGWKSAALLLCLTLPLLLVTTLLAASFLPSLLDLMGVASDNCKPDHTHHPHLCPLHPSASIQGVALWLCVVGLGWAGTVVIAGARAAVCVFRTGLEAGVVIRDDELPENQRTRLAAASGGLQIPVQVIRSPIPVAALVGIVRPRVVLSTTLLELLPPDELLAVLHHEAAHHERKDLLAEACTGMLAACHLPVLGRWLEGAFRDAVEAACDERAAARLGSGLPGASALLRLHRWASTTRGGLELPGGVAVGLAKAGSSRNAELRIRRLIDWSGAASGPAPFSARVWAPVGGMVVLSMAASEPVHHLLEDLLGMLSG